MGGKEEFEGDVGGGGRVAEEGVWLIVGSNGCADVLGALLCLGNCISRAVMLDGERQGKERGEMGKDGILCLWKSW